MGVDEGAVYVSLAALFGKHATTRRRNLTFTNED
jgi:hypothetical protein